MTEMMNEKRVGQEKNRQQPKAERKRDADEGQFLSPVLPGFDRVRNVIELRVCGFGRCGLRPGDSVSLVSCQRRNLLQ